MLSMLVPPFLYMELRPKMKLISSVTVGAGGSSTISWTNIPQTGTDLILMLSGRSQSSSSADVYLQLNGSDYGSGGYMVTGSGSSISSPTMTNGLFLQNGVPPTTSAANTFGLITVYLANYTSSLAKSISVEAVSEDVGVTTNASFVTGNYNSTTSAVTSLAIGNSVVFAPGSTASLYMVTKGSGGATVA